MLRFVFRISKFIVSLGACSLILLRCLRCSSKPCSWPVEGMGDGNGKDDGSGNTGRMPLAISVLR